MTAKLCSTCKWMENPGEFSECANPNQCKKEVLTGFENEWRRWKYCFIQRQEGFIMRYLMQTCGKGGRWWEPK